MSSSTAAASWTPLTPQVRNSVARDIVFLEAVEINPVVVHGGGKAITRAMEKAGLKANFVQGQRVTDDAAVRIVDQVLSRRDQPRSSRHHQIVWRRCQRVCRARHLQVPPRRRSPGPDGNPLDIGFVGEVVAVNTAPLLECIAKGITPVISPTARGEDGQIYNCNADVAAAQAAIALKARRLVFMSDVPGLLENPKKPDSVIAHLKSSQVDGLKQAGVIDKGMIPKVDSAVAAIKSGVEKVSFVDGRVPHAVMLEIFTDEGIGTEVVL